MSCSCISFETPLVHNNVGGTLDFMQLLYKLSQGSYLIMDEDRKLPGNQAEASNPRIVINPSTSYLQLKENYPTNDVLWEVTVTDPDPGENLVVTMGPKTRHFVEISQDRGPSPLHFNVTLKTELDKETYRGVVQLKFTVTDKTRNVEHLMLDIYITEINDNPPIFQDIPYEWNIPELPINSSSYYAFSAPDLDQTMGFGDIVFTMKPFAQSQNLRKMYNETFSLTNEPNNVARVNLLKPIDFETNSFYQFIVTATDGGGWNTSTPLVVRVLDVQDQPPFFNNLPYKATIKEDAPVGSSVIQVDAQDGDAGVPNAVTYTLGGQCSSFFRIARDGSISTSKPVDRDAGVIRSISGTCKLEVTAVEINNMQQIQYGNTSTIAYVTVEIEDINDNPPRFNVEMVNAEVAENTPAYVPIKLHYPLNVSDIDQGDNAMISLKLVWMNGSECDAFTPVPQIVSGNGNLGISVKSPLLLDFETRKNLTFKIVATNPSNASFKDEVTVVLNITDVNDNNPEFGNINKEFYIFENSPNGTYLAIITATDEDSTSKGNLAYSITGGSERFHVDHTTGAISTVCSSNCFVEFDRERYGNFTIVYSVKDEGGRQDFVSLTVHLNDSNDNTPTFYRNEYISFIQENDDQYVYKTPLVVLDGSDKDETSPNNTIWFSLPNPNISYPKVRLEPTGELYLMSAVDYEMLPNLTTGEIHIDVMVTDGGIPQRNSTATVVIIVQDENDNWPNFTSSIYSASVPEDATSNITQRHNVSAFDADGTSRNSDFHYFIVAGSYERFAINSTTGEVTVQINAKLDRETRPFYNITLNAIDQGFPAHTSTASLIINVTDVNDEKPMFDQFDSKDAYYAEVLEDDVIGYNVKRVSALDMDSGAMLVYNITDVAATDENGKAVNKSSVKDYFAIHADNGTVYVKSALDRETAAIVTLTLQVQDMNAVHNQPQTATAQLRLKLLDVNDNDPTFQNNYYVKVPENAPSPHILLQLTATDPDINRTITYTLNPGPQPTDSFGIEESTGKLIKIGQLDREMNDSVILTVIATDSGIPPRNTTVDVYVTIVDVNDNPPVFTSMHSNIHVSEGEPNGYPVIKMNATDFDAPPYNNNITYSITFGSGGYFTINSTTGVISLKTELDRESYDFYTMIILASDNPEDPTLSKSSTSTLSILIDDVNDNHPTFTHTSYTASVLENIINGTSVITVTAYDNDKAGTSNSRLEYSLLEHPEGLFVINAATGEIKVNATLKDKVGNFTLVVVAKDFGIPQLMGTATVRISVKEVNAIDVFKGTGNTELSPYTLPSQKPGGSQSGGGAPASGCGACRPCPVGYVIVRQDYCGECLCRYDGGTMATTTAKPSNSLLIKLFSNIGNNAESISKMAQLLKEELQLVQELV